MKRDAIDGGPARLGRELAASTPSVPIPPPGLLERAKKLGAISAGPAMLVPEDLAAVTPAAKALPSQKKSKSRKKPR